jgi:hypothetical protein
MWLMRANIWLLNSSYTIGSKSEAISYSKVAIADITLEKVADLQEDGFGVDLGSDKIISKEFPNCKESASCFVDKSKIVQVTEGGYTFNTYSATTKFDWTEIKPVI